MKGVKNSAACPLEINRVSNPPSSTCTEGHTYIFINPRSRMTIQDAKTVSDEIEKGAKKN